MVDYDRADVRAAEMAKIFEMAAYARQNPTIRLGVIAVTGATPPGGWRRSSQRGNPTVHSV
jgi:hypothetical protein